MSILSKVKSAVKKVATGIKSGFQQAVKGDFSGLKKTASNVYGSVKSLGSTINSNRSSALASVRTATNPLSGVRILNPSTASKSQVDSAVSQGNVLRIGSSTPGLSFNSYGGATPVPVTLMGGQRTPASSSFSSPTSTTPTSRSGATTSNLNISSETMSSAPSVSLPDAPSYTDVGQVNNAGLIGALQDSGQTFDPESGLFVPDNKDNTKSEEERRKKDFEDLLDMAPQKESVFDDKEVKRQQKEVQQRKQELNNYTAQLNNVVAKQNADLLNLRGIGSKEGVTETVYGGQAATINREAAIKALPIQAQIAAAQGNVELAQDYLSELITVKRDQIDADYSYNKMKFDAISGFLTSEEKIRLDKITKNEDRAYEQAQKNLDLQDEWAKYAIQNGQGHLVSRIHGLNIGSPDFQQKLGDIISNIDDLDAIKKRKDANGSSVALTPEDERILAGGGFSATEIDAIASDVSEYGINAVLEGLTDKRQKDAIMKVYGGGEDNTQFLTRDYFEGLFTKDQLEKAAAEAGFGDMGEGVFNLKDVDTDAYLTQIEKSISAYQSAGYTDKEILNMMK